MNGGKEYKASRQGGLERVRGGEKGIIREREREEKKNGSVQADSQGHVSHYHELISRVLPDADFSQETFHGFQQIRCGGADNHHYCKGNE